MILAGPLDLVVGPFRFLRNAAGSIPARRFFSERVTFAIHFTAICNSRGEFALPK